jgi:hypothetical protein
LQRASHSDAQNQRRINELWSTPRTLRSDRVIEFN